ncbi:MULTISPECIES: 3'(2'),5'-bisphosphate nucleotidase CysQ [unclassified Hyphomicrobium]|uniref:3'(2'),5'-bisphosphate nucleotidase CysQ n=1 Tax=unclassified Hyphomicrobium TaxID=2619925 RepID=UPI000213E194|nr:MULTISPECIES: 3'(2'),5'-bisphosphate nucleotidase CysQ [unclassified Hyphomicrobium]CCB65204.1 3'(2'),5'-bisphosphate nucleotidase CysQ [Hyphomicrobium sp. MC1]
MLDTLERIAIEAGTLIAKIRQGGANVMTKSDGSPVTDADQAAEDLIVRALQRVAPDIPIIAEESAASCVADHSTSRALFFVDPLDGTKEFIRGRPDYTVNICLVENRKPKLGVVFAPARGELFSSDGLASYRSAILQDASIGERSQIRASCGDGRLTAVASASHGNVETEDFLQKLPVDRKVSVGSSLKFCLVAMADAHIYPRFGRTMQWDTAAGDAVLRGAGGCTLTSDGRELEYGVPCAADGSYDNPHFISYGGDAETLRTLLQNCSGVIDA